jgi:hypothetical protein
MGTAARDIQSTPFEYLSTVCRKKVETTHTVTLVCFEEPVVGQPTPATREIILRKTLTKSPDWAMDEMKRKRLTCDTCPASPVWQDPAGDPLPQGPEVSYGIPFRWSASRLLAGDVKRWLCGSHHNDTAECKKMINDTSWGLESFIDHFTGDARQLFYDVTSATDVLPALKDNVEKMDEHLDSQLWNGAAAGWVGCSQQPGIHVFAKCFLFISTISVS